jgi:DNA-binding transcriptional regulator YiaG
MTEAHVTEAIAAGVYPLAVLPRPETRRQIRHAAGVSMNGLARALGTNRWSIRQWETGEREPSARFDLVYRRALAVMQATNR